MSIRNDSRTSPGGGYRYRNRRAEEIGEFALSEILRRIIVQGQGHEIDLASALVIEVPPGKVPAVRNGPLQVKDRHSSRR
ncbi:MAG: hypothetical protein RIS76_4144 [Verrucomicrobiota bacterium]